MIGAFFYVLYCCQLIHSSTMMIYVTSVLLGTGAAIIWVSLGVMLSMNSDQENSLKHASLFWTLFHVSGVIGNIIVYYSPQLNEASENLVDTYKVVLTKINKTILCVDGSDFADNHLNWSLLHDIVQET